MTVGINFNISGRPPRVLVAPLNWGLGHATRCIPLINELITNGCEVVIAASGNTVPLLRQEFPQLELLEIAGYRINYSRHPFWLPFRLLLQFPRLWRTITQEHRWLQKAVVQHRIDAIISDNRFGLYHETLTCVYITHQLRIQTGYRMTDWFAQQMHYRFINRYDECWVPDTAGSSNLAGLLSHPVQLPVVPVQYLDPLSRLIKQPTDPVYDILLLLSGPEPQRTLFEQKLLEQLAVYSCKALLVRGLPGEGVAPVQAPPHVAVINHLPATELGRVIQQANWIICRSGYTTVMDLVHLGKKAILVPTPGQTEQAYLGRYLQQQGLFYSVSQQELNIATDIPKAASFNAANFNISAPAFKHIIANWAADVQKNTLITN